MRDQELTILRFKARMTRAHRRGNVKPVKIKPELALKYMHSVARQFVGVRMVLQDWAAHEVKQ